MNTINELLNHLQLGRLVHSFFTTTLNTKSQKWQTVNTVVKKELTRQAILNKCAFGFFLSVCRHLQNNFVKVWPHNLCFMHRVCFLWFFYELRRFTRVVVTHYFLQALNYLVDEFFSQNSAKMLFFFIFQFLFKESQSRSVGWKKKRTD